jgi:hypothetical protein
MALSLHVALLPGLARSAEAAKAAVAEKPDGSSFVQCDGKPAKLTAGELAAVLLAITVTGGIVGGLVGAPETADSAKRLTGADGVAACDAALGSESDPFRRVELTLAKAIHELEAGHPEMALALARSAPDLAGDRKEDLGFRRSLKLSAMELEAAALLRLGKPAEAEATAFRMAAAAPYDLITFLRAASYADLTADMTPAKLAFFDQYQRLLPRALLSRFEARQWSGEWSASAHDLEMMTAAYDAFRPEPEPGMGLTDARKAVAYMLAGDMERSNSLAFQARQQVDDMVKSGKALEFASQASLAEELIDFQGVGRMLAEGKAKQARAAFAARGRWLAPTPPAVALLTERLRSGAAAEELTGALSREPSAIRADALTAKAAALKEKTDKPGVLFAAIRTPMASGNWSSLSRTVWRIEKQPALFLKKTPKDRFKGEMLFAYSYAANGSALGEAMMMHCAVVAKSRGKAGCMLVPYRDKLYATFVLVGSPGDPGLEPALMMNADSVMAELGMVFPKPVPRR